TYGDFSRYPGGPGVAINLDPPLPAYSEEEDDAVTVAMRPLEEQLAQPGADLAWMRAPAPPVAMPASVVMSAQAVVQPAVALPAPPVARAPSVRPPTVTPVAVVPPAFVPPGFVPPAVAARPPPFAGYERAPSPPAAAVRADSVPNLPAPVARAVVPASPRPAAVRPPQIAAPQARAMPHQAHAMPQARALTQTRSIRRPPKGNLLLLAFATTVAALVTMLGTGVVLYRIGAFEPGSARVAH
ncbi:MAG: hypothetical protein ABW217_10790, partial [Polyangiaceae bacterium]